MPKTYKVYASKYKNDLKASIEDWVKPLIKHLIKYYCFPNKEHRKNWLDEMYGFFNSTPKLRYTKRLPDEDFLFHACWDDNADYYDKFYTSTIKDVKMDYGETPIHNMYVTKIFVIDYFHWLAKELSINGSVGKWEMKEYLDDNVDDFDDDLDIVSSFIK